jgi:hypothetical protein
MRTTTAINDPRPTSPQCHTLRPQRWVATLRWHNWGQMKNKIVVHVMLLCLLVSCDWVDRTVCGEPTGAHKVFIDLINQRYSNALTIKQVPCYPGYLQVDCKTSVPGELLDKTGSSARKLNWIEILVYDKNDKLIRGETGSM